MPNDTETQDRTLDEQIAAAFAKPVGEGALVPIASTNLSVSDAIITAQKVAVERDEAKILQRVKVFANAAGEDWYYRYPVKSRNGKIDWIEGPSIKCANNVARYYGNCQVDTRVVDTGDSWIIYARFVDYETGFSYTRPFQQRKGQQSVKTGDAGRQLDIALQIGVSKAIRNVVCNALETFTNFAFEEAKGAIVTKVGKDIERYRERIVTRLGEMGIDPRRVEAMIGRGVKDWLAPDVARIIAEIQAIGDGMATADETWPVEGGAPPRPTREQFQEQKEPGKPVTEADKTAGQQQSQQQSEPEMIELTDHEGVVMGFETSADAVEGFRSILERAAQEQGIKGLEGIVESNDNFLKGLGSEAKELGAYYTELCDGLKEREQKATEQAKATKPAAQAPAEAKAAPQTSAAPAEVVEPQPKTARSEIWSKSRLTITVPMKGNAINFAALRDNLLHIGSQAHTAAEVARFEVENEESIRRLKDAYPDWAKGLQASFDELREKLP